MGTATIAGQTFTVNQAAFVAPCTYSLASTTPQPIPALGTTTGTVTVTTTSACAWTATSNNLPWLIVTSGASGTGTGTVGFSVLPNVAGPRSGTLTIAGQTFTVMQN
jgi:hypothetical protein